MHFLLSTYLMQPSSKAKTLRPPTPPGTLGSILHTPGDRAKLGSNQGRNPAGQLRNSANSKTRLLAHLREGLTWKFGVFGWALVCVPSIL